MVNLIHSNFTGVDAVHPAAIVNTADPGAIGAHKFWVDTSGTPFFLKKRNAANSGWDTIGPSSNLPVQSASAPALATAGTITTAAVSVARVAPAAAVTGVIMQSGTFGGQEVVVWNESADGNTITMDVSGTSHVADGVNCIIRGLSAMKFIWNSSVNLWGHYVV